MRFYSEVEQQCSVKKEKDKGKSKAPRPKGWGALPDYTE